MLPGRCGSTSVTSRRISDPTPSSEPSFPTSAAPLQLSVGGEVKIALSSRYSQFPVKDRRETTWASVASSRPLWFTISTGSLSASFAESPSGSGEASSGTIERTSAKPETWS